MLPRFRPAGLIASVEATAPEWREMCDAQICNRSSRGARYCAPGGGAGAALSCIIPYAGNRDQRRNASCSRRRQGAGGRSAPWLWRDRRHVGAARSRADAGPHGDRARPARYGLILTSGKRLRQEDPRRRHRRPARRVAYRQGRTRDPTTSETWSATPLRRSIQTA